MIVPRYYENLSVLHENTMPARAYYIPASRRMDNLVEHREESDRMQLLNGTWKFQYFNSIYDIQDSFFEKNYDTENFDEIQVPSVWQMAGYDTHQYTNIRYPFPFDPPYVPQDIPCGAYVHTFEYSRDEKAPKSFLNFEGVDSCFYVWINGSYIGYSQVSHMTSEFDVTDVLQDGTNTVAVLVMKWCDGSYLEDQDKFRMSGIFRDVYILKRPKQAISDYHIKTRKGTAKATVGNYMVVLRNDPLVRESMKYNKLTGRIDIVKKLWWNEEICKLDDDGRTYFYYFFERYYKLTSEKCMDKALRIEANSRAYHPICEYLEQLEWDGQERIRYVLQRYMGADASDFVYEVVKHFLMEALSRIYRPGCKADEMLCLVGQQGAGKSTFFRFLALNDDWFSDDLKQLNDSKIYEHLRGHWIMEMSEMIAAISAKSNEEIKSFLTRQKDTYRNPYDKYEEDRKRQCIFAGSTNTRQFIPFDRTGARRFLPIAIDSSKAEKHILDDEKEARAYFDQLWAEAMEIYWSTENKSSLLKFSKEMEQKISEYRKQFTQEDTMAGMIQGWLDAYKGTHVCSVQIWKEAFDHFEREPKKFETNEICSIMDTQITGWKRDGIHRFSKEGYGRQRSWVREGTEEGGNEPDKDGFTKLTKAEQLELPFDLPDREKG